MRAAKVLMEQQLQETAGELVAAERELAARADGEPAALHPAGGGACIGLPGPGALPQRGSAGGGDEEALVGALRAENDAIMQVPGPGAPVSPRPESASTQAGEACMPPRLSSREQASGRVLWRADLVEPPRARRLVCWHACRSACSARWSRACPPQQPRMQRRRSAGSQVRSAGASSSQKLGAGPV
jgi:hypothetical protein